MGTLGDRWMLGYIPGVYASVWSTWVHDRSLLTAAYGAFAFFPLCLWMLPSAPDRGSFRGFAGLRASDGTTWVKAGEWQAGVFGPSRLETKRFPQRLCCSKRASA